MIKLEDLTEKQCQKFLNEMAKQCFYGNYVGKFKDTKFIYDGIEWEFTPYFGPQIWVRPAPPNDCGHPKSAFFGWYDGVAEDIRKHFS